MKTYLEAYQNIQDYINIQEASNYIKKEILPILSHEYPDDFLDIVSGSETVEHWLKERQMDRFIKKFNEYKIVLNKSGHAIIIKHPKKESYYIIDDQYDIAERLPGLVVKKLKKLQLLESFDVDYYIPESYQTSLLLEFFGKKRY